MTVNSVVDEVGQGAQIDAVLQSRSTREAVAERSYWHPNGFLKIVLDGRSGQSQVRLHVWPSPVRDDDPHDHAWRYRSQVLAGALLEVRYDEVGPGLGAELMWRHTYRRSGPGRFQLDAPVLVNLREIERRVYLTSMASHGDATRIHRFTPGITPAVTLLAVGPPQQAHSSVYRREAVADQVVSPRPTTAGEVGSWVEFARAAQCST